MDNNNTNSDSMAPLGRCERGDCLIGTITPLAKKLNCLDIDQISDICINEIPGLVGASLASLYLLDEESDILHLEKYNHPFLINNVVSLNQSPPSPMVAAVRSKNLLVVNDIEQLKTHNQTKAGSKSTDRNYKTKSCLIASLLCQNRVGGGFESYRQS